MHGTAIISGHAFITDGVANCNIFLFTDLTFLESSRRADVMLQLTCNTEIFTVKWQKLSERPKMVHPSPFLDPTFGDP